MQQGTIKNLIAGRGYGFISAEDGDLFFHHSAVPDGAFEQLQEGQTVEYEKGMGRQDRPCATLVQPIETTDEVTGVD